MDDKLFALRKNLELLELEKGVCKISWQTEQVLGVLEQKPKRKGKQDIRKAKFEIETLILDIKMGKIKSAIKNRERELEANKEIVAVQEIEVFKPALKESSLEDEQTMIECSRKTLTFMEVSASFVSHTQETKEIPIRAQGDVVKGIKKQSHKEILEEEELTLNLETQEVLIQAQDDEFISIISSLQPNPLNSPLNQVEIESKEPKFNHDRELQSDLSIDEYIWVFNKLMGANNCVWRCSYELAPMTFKTSYAFKKNGVLSTLEFLTLKRCDKFSRMIFMMFNLKDLRANPFEEGEFDAYRIIKHLRTPRNFIRVQAI